MNTRSCYAITPGAGNLPKLELSAPDGARSEIYLLGAHVTSWVPAGGGERLYMSRKSEYQIGEPIRGGIPVAFPQFGTLGPLPIHGLARLMPWDFVGAEIVGDRACATFRLRDTQESRDLWPHAFLAELSVSIGGSRLEVMLTVTNPGAGPFAFTNALHTYLSVMEISLTQVKGLVGLPYRDAAAGGIEKLESQPQVDFTGEVNRIYFNAPAEAQVVEPGRVTAVQKAGFTDTVVWNPAAEKCAVVADMEPADYRRFVCVEAAVVGQPVQLAPGERWMGMQTLVA